MGKIINIITLKHGTKYNAMYVNNMYNMIKRNITLPFRFYCVTDDHTDLKREITVVKLPEDDDIKGWWWKPYLFNTGLFKEGTNFYIDLDMVIINNIDDFMTYKPGKFLGLRNYLYLREGHEGHRSLASGIMRWENGMYNMVWTRLTRDKRLINNFDGDQDYIWAYHKDHIDFFPDEYTMSYKWDHIKDHKITDKTKVIVFHGEPRPHQVNDQLIKEHWL